MATVSILYFKNQTTESSKDKKVKTPKATITFYIFNLRQELNRKQPDPSGLLKAKYELARCLLRRPPQDATDAKESKLIVNKVIIYKWRLRKKIKESEKERRMKLERKGQRKAARLREQLISKYDGVTAF